MGRRGVEGGIEEAQVLPALAKLKSASMEYGMAKRLSSKRDFGRPSFKPVLDLHSNQPEAACGKGWRNFAPLMPARSIKSGQRLHCPARQAQVKDNVTSMTKPPA